MNPNDSHNPQAPRAPRVRRLPWRKVLATVTPIIPDIVRIVLAMLSGRVDCNI